MFAALFKIFLKTLILAFEANSDMSKNCTFCRIIAHCVRIVVFVNHMPHKNYMFCIGEMKFVI